MKTHEKRCHASKGIYRTRQELEVLKEKVLNDWAFGMPSKAIATRHKINKDYAETIVIRARKAGDPRAERRRAENAWVIGSTLTARLSELYQEGCSIDEMAARTGASKSSIRSRLHHSGLDAKRLPKAISLFELYGRRVVELKIAGWSFREIANQMKIHQYTAYLWFCRFTGMQVRQFENLPLAERNRIISG